MHGKRVCPFFVSCKLMFCVCVFFSEQLYQEYTEHLCVHNIPLLMQWVSELLDMDGR